MAEMALLVELLALLIAVFFLFRDLRTGAANSPAGWLLWGSYVALVFSGTILLFIFIQPPIYAGIGDYNIRILAGSYHILPRTVGFCASVAAIPTSILAACIVAMSAMMNWDRRSARWCLFAILIVVAAFACYWCWASSGAFPTV